MLLTALSRPSTPSQPFRAPCPTVKVSITCTFLMPVTGSCSASTMGTDMPPLHAAIISGTALTIAPLTTSRIRLPTVCRMPTAAGNSGFTIEPFGVETRMFSNNPAFSGMVPVSS